MKHISTLNIKSSISGHHKLEKPSIKKAPDNRPKQSGFFDLGISLMILAMSGSAVYVTERNHDEKIASLQESTEITASQQMENDNTNIARANPDNPDFVLQ